MYGQGGTADNYNRFGSTTDTLHFNNAESRLDTDSIELKGRDHGYHDNDLGRTDVSTSNGTSDSAFSIKSVLAALLLVVLTTAIIVLTVLGINHFQPLDFYDQRPCNVYRLVPPTSPDFREKCLPDEDAIRSVQSVEIVSKRQHFPMKNLDEEKHGFLYIELKPEERNIIVEYNSTEITCNEEDYYNITFFDSSGQAVITTNLSVVKQEFLQEPTIGAFPYYDPLDSKTHWYVSCKINNTGCKHLMFIPEVKEENNQILFLNDTHCNYNFVKKNGGNVVCWAYFSSSLGQKNSTINCKPLPSYDEEDDLVDARHVDLATGPCVSTKQQSSAITTCRMRMGKYQISPNVNFNVTRYTYDADFVDIQFPNVDCDNNRDWTISSDGLGDFTFRIDDKAAGC